MDPAILLGATVHTPPSQGGHGELSRLSFSLQQPHLLQGKSLFLFPHARRDSLRLLKVPTSPRAPSADRASTCIPHLPAQPFQLPLPHCCERFPHQRISVSDSASVQPRADHQGGRGMMALEVLPHRAARLSLGEAHCAGCL